MEKCLLLSGLFQRALLHEKQAFMSSKNLTKSPTFQQLYPAIQSSDAYGGIFPEMFKLMNIILALPVGMDDSQNEPNI